jgi:multicomponent Na+:H+ antiporter subunit E
MIHLYSFSILFGFWILLSGQLDSFHIMLGVISSALITWLSDDLLFQEQGPQKRLSDASRFLIFHIPYIPWLLMEISKSAIQVTMLALAANMSEKLEPHIVKFRTRLKSTAARVTLANSITLTPGTITVRVVDDEFVVHALTSELAKGMPGEMEKRIARIFGEELS